MHDGFGTEENTYAGTEPEERRNNFEEVALGYSLEEAMKEAERCLNCKKPLCVEGCPVSVNIPEFIQAIVRETYSRHTR